MPSSRRFTAFTLVELLIALAIIALLLAILLPVLHATREKGRQSECESNLHQIGKSLQIYLADNDGNWPDESVWRAGVVANLHSQTAIGCPDTQLTLRSTNIDGISGYAYNTALAFQPVNGNLRPVHESAIVFPSTTVSVCEEAAGVVVSFGPDPYKYTHNLRPFGEEQGWKRHSGGANYLFCDGHVKWYLPEAVGDNTALKGGNTGVSPSFALNNTAHP